ncbi:MAG: carbohydrate ABC transporter permease [Ruthenibacterium sp.]
MENKKQSRQKRSIPWGRCGITLLLVALSLTILLPLAWVFIQSVKPKADFFGATAWAMPSRIALENFSNAWTSAHMGQYFINTLFVTAMSMVLVLLLSVPCAYALSRFHFRFSSVISMVLMGGIFINVNYIVVPIYTMISQFGRITGIKGLVDNLFVLSLIYAITSVPFAVYLLGGYLTSLQKEYEEAARIDGCGYFGTLFRVVMPLMSPSIITVMVFNFLKFWNEYLIGITFLSNTEHWTLSIGLLNIMEVERVANDYGRLYAGLTIAMIPTIVFYCLVQNQLTKGITTGGIKG